MPSNFATERVAQDCFFCPRIVLALLQSMRETALSEDDDARLARQS